ncbi:MAG: TusE/DsrC/DsvC family sulfur relay protein [Chromatiales bacterium]|nr:TusE/DsrC/DsvC family sulfur relay protein [Chromatiales bacterium]
MITVRVAMRFTNEPLKRTPVVLQLDANDEIVGPVLTDRSGVATFDLPPTSGRIYVSDVERFHGRLTGEILIQLWSITQSPDDSSGAPGIVTKGSNAYPGMAQKTVLVGDREVLTDSEGYLIEPSDWSEEFAKALATFERLELTSEHWEVIRYLREYYMRCGTQASVREMVKHFRRIWGSEKGSSRYLHDLFPRGGPQKQGNRLAGLLRTKGEH